MQTDYAQLLQERLREEEYQSLMALDNARLHRFVADQKEAESLLLWRGAGRSLVGVDRSPRAILARVAAGGLGVATGARRVATGARRVAAGARRVATGARRVATGIRRVGAGARRVAAGNNGGMKEISDVEIKGYK